MPTIPTIPGRLLGLMLFALAVSPLTAAEVTPMNPAVDTFVLPKPTDIQMLQVYPPQLALRGREQTAQLIVTAKLNDGREQDLSGDVTYTVVNDKAARVSTTGRITPLANGTTEIIATFGDKTAKIALTATAIDQDLPINFTNQVVPIFTKLGCNAGGCHGKIAGQNGFRLSLLGFDAELDYQTLVKEARGRRLFPAAPDASILLTKATGRAPHGGGRKMEPDSDEYKVVRRWIATGAPYGNPATDPAVTKITVYPEQRVLTRQNKQQFAVYAHFNDGTVEDVTRRAQYESNDQEIATVEPSGLIRTLSMSGQAAIMARFQGMVTVVRVTVPLGIQTPAWQFSTQSVVDQATQKQWKQLGLVPSARASDEVFIRRISLDLTGTLPTPTQVSTFLADADPAKRDKLIDRLLESPEYGYYFANKWSDILRVKRRGDAQRTVGTFGFHEWIRDAVQNDKPYNEFAREILGATGDERSNPPTVWYKELTTPEQFVDDTAQVFLGLRIACAQCHHHPYEKWSQDDYWGLAAFFGRVGRKTVMLPGAPANQQQSQVLFTTPSGGVTNKRTGQAAKIKPLDAAELELTREDDPRQKLADWMTQPTNPFFAKAVANRYWAHFFGRGIVDPLDDMRVTNPPSNPELLDALAKNLIDNKYSLKSLIKTIVKSDTYQLSAVPNEFNKHDKQAYARYYPKRLSAEVLLDAVGQVTASPTMFGNLPNDQYAPKRAIMLPDESFTSYFLDVFGRPQRISACECERVSEANLAQALHLLNSDEVQNKLAAGNGRADLLAKDMRPDAEKVEELFLWAFGRKPTPTDSAAALAHIAKHPMNKKLAYENLLWALLNTKEFIFNQ